MPEAKNLQLCFDLFVLKANKVKVWEWVVVVMDYPKYNPCFVLSSPIKKQDRQ